MIIIVVLIITVIMMDVNINIDAAVFISRIGARCVVGSDGKPS